MTRARRSLPAIAAGLTLTGGLTLAAALTGTTPAGAAGAAGTDRQWLSHSATQPPSHSVTELPGDTATGSPGDAATGSPGEPASDPRLARFYAQHVAWHGCQTGPEDADGQALDEAGAQCAGITVPVDYAHPEGRTITVALSRMAATDTAHRIGTLVFNLGGPAIPVVTAVPLARAALGETGARFDIVGMDQRFAGRSTPLDCGWPQSWQPRSAGTDRRGFDEMVRLTRDLARRCAPQAAVLPQLATANAARDLDVIRGALGEPKLSYLGYSQGTVLGALYTQLFPHRADRIVLDSALDPQLIGVRGIPFDAPVREQALHEWATWAAARDGQYHLGATRDAVLAAVTALYQGAARHPIPVGRFMVDDGLLPGLLLEPINDDTEAANAAEAQLVQFLQQAAAGQPVQPPDAVTTALAGLLTGADSAMRSEQTAIMCADATVSRNPETYWRDIQAHRATEPIFGPESRTITPCASWPVRPLPPVRIGNAVPALVVNAARDINTQLAFAQAMHRALTGSRMITLAGVRTHGVYALWGSECVDSTVNAYLVTGTLPAADLTCAS